MADKPILFSGPMVQAMLAGRKTKTRRLRGLSDVNQQPDAWSLNSVGPLDYMTKPSSQGKFGATFESSMIEKQTLHICPQVLPWKIGDRLWVKETWSDVNFVGEPGIAYRADDHLQYLMHRDDFLDDGGAFNYGDQRLEFGKGKLEFNDWWSDLLSGREGTWRPSIFMPRWISRLTLIVTDVRVERLQDISAADAEGEGVEVRLGYHDEDVFKNYGEGQDWSGSNAARLSFESLWDSLNAKRGFGWDANPWVTATTYTVHQCNIDEMPCG